MKKERIDNKCTHCKHGLKEYIRIAGAFVPIRCIDCECPVLNAKERKKRIKNKADCDYYQLDEFENNPMQELIKYRLLKMAEEIHEFATVLMHTDKTEK